MLKQDKIEVLRKQYVAFYSKDGVNYEEKTINLYEIVHICDYYYGDYGNEAKKVLPKSAKNIQPVYFHHNDYWILDGQDLARVIFQLTIFYKKDWRQVISGKWRLRPSWMDQKSSAQSTEEEL